MDEITLGSLAGFINLKVGSLPVRHLGVPLISRKPKDGDYKALLDRIRSRISAWTSKFLSLAGRLHLVVSVFSSTYTYWCNIFFLLLQ